MDDTPLQKALREYLAAHGLSVAAFERKAGLKINVVRNILNGQSKKPTAHTLQAIASTIGCHVKDLMEGRTETPSKLMMLAADSSPLEHPEALQSCLKGILETLPQIEDKLTLKQILYILEEAYEYSITSHPPRGADMIFIEWFMKRDLKKRIP